MSLGSKSKGVQGYSPSSLLSSQENERLEDLLGRRCAVSPSWESRREGRIGIFGWCLVCRKLSG
jgi:hypothetical protein